MWFFFSLFVHFIHTENSLVASYRIKFNRKKFGHKIREFTTFQNFHKIQLFWICLFSTHNRKKNRMQFYGFSCNFLNWIIDKWNARWSDECWGEIGFETWKVQNEHVFFCSFFWVILAFEPGKACPSVSWLLNSFMSMFLACTTLTRTFHCESFQIHLFKFASFIYLRFLCFYAHTKPFFFLFHFVVCFVFL